MNMRTTKKQFRLFEREARKWVDKLGLKDWCVYARHEDLGDVGTLARCKWNLNQRQAWLSLNTTTPACDDDAIKRAALHECLELLFCCCTDIMWRVSAEGIVDRETHKIIRALENLLMGDPK